MLSRRASLAASGCFVRIQTMTDLSRGALIFQHGADGPPGVLGQWLEARGVPMEVIDLKADGRPPPGAVESARRPTGPQAFRHGRNLGLQFHPEVTAAIVEEWIDTDPRLEERGIDREEFRASGALREQAAAENARRLFDAWLRAWANGG